MSYAEPFFPAWWADLTESDQSAYTQAHERHTPLGDLAMSMSRYMRMLGRKLPVLPLRTDEKYAGESGLPDDILNAAGYRELLEAMLLHGHAAIAEFRVFRDKAMAATTKAGPE